MDGMPGMRSRRSPPVDNKRFYDLLDVDKDASTSQIKKAYRKLALTHHPDRGGDEERFKEITTAFEVLSDDDKRAIYDEHGEEGLRDGGGPTDAHDIFNAMFGGGFGGQSRGPRKGENVVHSLSVTLEDLYNGKMSKLAIIRNRVCKACKGKGASRPEGVSTCSACNGQGVRIMLNQLGPGMVQQVQTRCNQCSGLGETIVERFKCNACNGAKVTKERKVLEVYVDKGMQNGQKITFTGEANENPGLVAGDVVVVLRQTEHRKFARKGNNLVLKKEISISDALCGFQFYIKQLDGRELLVTSREGSVIKPGTVKSVPNEGMPTWKRPDDRGYLFIEFAVNFPKSVSPEQVAALQSVLGPRTQLPAAKTDEVEEVHMFDFQQEHLRSRDVHSNEYDEDEEEGPRVQCAQQ